MPLKALAVTQIILLVLGILVLSVVGYLLYSNFIGTSSGVSLENCKSTIVSACGLWKTTNIAPPFPAGCSDANLVSLGIGTAAADKIINAGNCGKVGIT